VSRRASRSFRIGAIVVVVSLALVGCTSGPSKTASRESSASESGKLSASASGTVTSGPAAKLMEPPGPVSAHPALLDEASAACRRAGASDITLCAGTVDAEVWGLPLVIMSHLRDLLACLFRVNVLDHATRLAGRPGHGCCRHRPGTNAWSHQLGERGRISQGSGGLGPAFWPERPARAPPQPGPGIPGVPWWDRTEPTTWSAPAWRRQTGTGCRLPRVLSASCFACTTPRHGYSTVLGPRPQSGRSAEPPWPRPACSSVSKKTAGSRLAVSATFALLHGQDRGEAYEPHGACLVELSNGIS
jgi:hypothetical protein